MATGQNQVSQSTGGPVHSAWWLLLILVLGLGLRWTELAWAQGYCFNMQGDGIIAVSVAEDYASGEAKSQYIGQPNYNEHAKLPGPAWTLFCYWGLKLGGAPEGIMFGMLLLNTLAIYLAYLLAKQTLGERAAIWTAFLMATFPRAIGFSVAIYNPNVMPFFGTAFFLALWRVTQRDKARAVFWLPFIPLFALQFHMSGLMLIPTALVVIILTQARLNFLWLATGLLAAVCTYLPYLRGDAANHWQNTAGIFSGGGSSHFSVEALKALTSSVGFLLSWSPGWIRYDHEYVEFGRTCFGSVYVLIAIYVVSTVLAGFLVAGALLVLKKSWAGFNWRSRREFFRASGINYLSLILGLPLLFALLGGKGFHARYCLVFIAPLFALAAVGLIRWLDSPQKPRLFRALFALVVATNLLIIVATSLYLNHLIEHGPAFTPSFRKLETVYQLMKHHAGGGRPIVVDDADYLKNPPADSTVFRDADLIWRFTKAREKASETVSSGTNLPAIYKLYPASQVSSNDPAAAFYGNGIALVAVSK